MESLPIIGITMGDPVGVGPEIIVKTLKNKEIYNICRPLVIGDLLVMERAETLIRSGLDFRPARSPEDAPYEYGRVDILPVSDLDPARLAPKTPCAETGEAMVKYITTAVDYARDNRIQAVTTGPIQKAAVHAAGYTFAGHTELLAQRTGTSKYVMMLAGDKLRVVLVTIHMAVSEIPAHVTREKFIETVEVTGQALKERFGIPRPKLAVAALNPHAGEEGAFGNEERDVIIPAMEHFKGGDIALDGPWPADTLFYHAQQGKWDAVVCMYHDQGLIPFKMIHFHDGVNTTLGLPIIRTSVDHGTAYDLAGTGKADHGSMEAAIRMAALQASHLK
ncbi:4-hydroxythreonine-4-phosphate dehydrogenase [Desulfatibacillum alkenivorans DSM 16219]|jgi:4-hydroxythreonine-4-phosphate dehydrogenase|uniref:4-hydroxythreonine-4-phosphate dehydrogenase n=1 Tax=Desulfatibacillum alkenivorans DSM 16219 TaxID=1121393 RepID=A0A1M6CCM3_9BACT|nr:4-hydroxythreonine-4-phosphate dehydrogenase PdxA [Desulfatibacillum alkenivorans]SHI58524.1 4-hydroxythreonine-4-phosphate dehydrogenase [Desulfatibacillum alkenivorans DSM 16219]